MGYRSDVAYVIKFDDIETRDNFVTLMLAKNEPPITQALSECEHGYKDDPIITFDTVDVKWYDSDPEVEAVIEFKDGVRDLGYEVEYVRIGEDYTDIDAQYSDRAEQYLSVHRAIHVDL